MSTITGNVSITVNGDARDYGAGRTVAELLGELGLHPQLVVVERNREILERRLLSSTEVLPGDVYELVHFVGGG